MNQTQRIFLLHGADSYTSWRRLLAIKARFLVQAGSLPDLTELDCRDTTSQTLRQALLTVPFFVSHRLFILKGPFSASKEIQQTLRDLLPELGPSTVVVFYQDGLADGRTSLFAWLKQHATVYTNDMPVGPGLVTRLREFVAAYGVTIDRLATEQFLAGATDSLWQLASEVAKVAAYVKSQQRSEITPDDVAAIGSFSQSVSVFGLTDAVRDGQLKSAVRHYRTLLGQEDPMAVAGMLGAFVRNLTKLQLANGAPVAELARVTKLNPYVIKLTLPLARRLAREDLVRAYRDLVAFDRSVKEGTCEASLGLLLLVIKLSGTLKRAAASS